jgi:hypothetical protein
LPENWFVAVPQLRNTQAGTAYTHLYSETPPISYRFEITFTATGTFSVNNPVHVKVVLRDLNITNFLDYFCGVSFTHAYSYPTEFTEDSPMNNVIIYLKNTGDGTYSGEGNVVWLVEGPTYMGEVINNPVGHVIPFDMFTQTNSVLTISSASDTLSIHFTQNTARLSWQIGSFSIIVLEPVFEAILLKEKKPT